VVYLKFNQKNAIQKLPRIQEILTKKLKNLTNPVQSNIAPNKITQTSEKNDFPALSEVGICTFILTNKNHLSVFKKKFLKKIILK
jgi:hypothetical protein